MTLDKIIPLFNPDEPIAIMGPGMRNVLYTGFALHAGEKSEILQCEVVRLGKELVSESIMPCIYVRMPG